MTITDAELRLVDALQVRSMCQSGFVRIQLSGASQPASHEPPSAQAQALLYRLPRRGSERKRERERESAAASWAPQEHHGHHPELRFEVLDWKLDAGAHGVGEMFSHSTAGISHSCE